MSRSIFQSPLFEKIRKVISSFNPKIQQGFSKPDPDAVDTDRQGAWGEFFDDYLRRTAEDKEKYMEYDLMDSEVPEITTALDIMADYVVYPDDYTKTKMFKVMPNKADKGITNAISEIDSLSGFKNEIHGIVRECCKYGDDVEEILRTVVGNYIARLKHVPINTINVNMKDGVLDNPPISQFDQQGKKVCSLDDESNLHFCLATDRRRYATYGKGVSRIEKSRLVYRQLRLMEEGVMITRLSRANQNFAMIIDVGDMVGDEALDYIDKYKRKISRRKYIDPSTGKMSFKFNPLSVVEDLVVPTRQGSGGNVIPLSNNNSGGKDIADINYFQDKMIYSTGVPKVMIGKEQDVAGKGTSDMQYISFLRAIRRIQIMIEPTIIKFYQLALAAKGFPNIQLTIEWPLLGTLDEERRWKIMDLKMGIAAKLSQDLAIVDDTYIYTQLMGMTDEEAADMQKRVDDIQKKNADYVNTQISQGQDMTASGKGMMFPSNDKGDVPADVKQKAREQLEIELNRRHRKIDEKLVDLCVENKPAMLRKLQEYAALTLAIIGE